MLPPGVGGVELGVALGLHGRCHELGALFVGVLVMRTLPIGVHIGTADVWKLPYKSFHKFGELRSQRWQGPNLKASFLQVHQGSYMEISKQ